MLKVKIEALLEKSDHCGYCTDNECYYTTETNTYYVNIPKEFEKYSIGILNEEEMKKYDWRELLPVLQLGYGSNYCSLCKECMDAKLDIHDYRYTIQSVEIIDN